MKTVANAIALGTLEHEVLQQPVNAIGHPVGLGLIRLNAEWFGHRAGLVDKNDQRSRIRAT